MSRNLLKTPPVRPRVLPMRALGRSGLKVSALGFGGNVLGWTVDEARGFQLLDAFTDAGHNLIDTANSYGPRGGDPAPGASEAILGRWLRRSGKRNQVLVATKGGREAGIGEAGLSKAAIVLAVEGSLKRLQTDRIDLYLAHVDDPATPQQESHEAHAALLKAGKIRALGASNFSPERLASAIELDPQWGPASYQVLQLGLNLHARAALEPYRPALKRLGLGVQAHSALARGFLTGKYRCEADLAKAARGDSVRPLLSPRGLRILRALDGVSVDLGVTPAQAALAWLLAQPDVDQALVSATHLGQLADLLSAVDLRLDKAALDLLERAAEPEG
jgi:aryl-alcohol dehydrogenase-like predicted oxidoreductase